MIRKLVYRHQETLTLEVKTNELFKRQRMRFIENKLYLFIWFEFSDIACDNQFIFSHLIPVPNAFNGVFLLSLMILYFDVDYNLFFLFG